MNTQTIERVEYVVRGLRAAMPRMWPEISRITGVPEKTICKIAYRETKDPRTSTTEALFAYFEKLEHQARRRRKTDLSFQPHQ